MLNLKNILGGLVFLTSTGLSAGLPLPDLVPLAPHSSNFKLGKDPIQMEVLAVESFDLEEFKKGVELNRTIPEEQRLRILSLIQELSGKPDHAYITLKTIPDVSEKSWFQLKELHLAETLGLQQDVQELGEQLQDKFFTPKLSIPKVEFCESVKAFGSYDTLDGKNLRSGGLVIIYIEIKGLKQENDQKKLNLDPATEIYKSRYTASFDILNSDDNTVFHHQTPNPQFDQSKSKRHDTYFWIKWRPNLTPGRYTLRAQIHDLLADRKTEFKKSFQLY